MKYKKSKCNVIVEQLDEKNELIYNTSTGKLGVMNLEAKQIYENIDIVDEFNCDEDAKRKIRTMRENGYIVDADFDELSMISASLR